MYNFETDTIKQTPYVKKAIEIRHSNLSGINIKWYII